MGNLAGHILVYRVCKSAINISDSAKPLTVQSGAQVGGATT